MILGVGNKIMNSFWDFIHERVENLHHKLAEKQNMTIIELATLKRLQEELEKLQLTSIHDVIERKLFNSTHKRKLNKEELDEKTAVRKGI